MPNKRIPSRGLQLHDLSDDMSAGLFAKPEEVLQTLSPSRAFVFHSDMASVEKHCEFLTKQGPTLVDHGLLLCCLADNQTTRDKILAALQTLAFVSKKRKLDIPVINVVRFSKSEPFDLPEFINRWESGPQYNGLVEIDSLTPIKDPQHQLFLKRAFSDCTFISAEKLPGGFSAEGVYLVSALLRDVAFVSRPLPFFAKIDVLDKIILELEHYRELVAPGIPFSSRPNLDEKRCFLGHTHGMIVGNFVEGSEDFYDVVKRGECHRPISTLFEEALRGWRGQAYEASSARRHSNVIDELFASVDSQIPSDERMGAARRLGATETYDKLVSKLRSVGDIDHRVAPSHGDLYANNIRVRQGGAILIDFASTEIAVSLMADPAYLEVSLAFNEYGAEDDFGRWKKTIDSLYQVDENADRFMRAPEPALKPDAREWLWNSIRQLRLIAIGAQETIREYQMVVAFFCLRESGFDPPQDNPEKRERRAYAYVICERLVKALVK